MERAENDQTTEAQTSGIVRRREHVEEHTDSTRMTI